MKEEIENNKAITDNNGADFSQCGKHRLMLWRIWDDSKETIMFIGLNPSTANATDDDPTIRRVKSLAKNWGYGGVYMLNLFTYISTDPKQLNMLYGNHNDADFYLKKIAESCEYIVAAWGNFEVKGRDMEIEKMFPQMLALKINKNGSPKHPLYCPSNSKLVHYNQFRRLTQ